MPVITCSFLVVDIRNKRKLDNSSLSIIDKLSNANYLLTLKDNHVLDCPECVLSTSLQDNNSNLFDNDDDGNKNDAILTSTFV